MIELKLMVAMYLFLVILFLYLKPMYFFNKEDETIKNFGVGKDKNIVPMWLVFIIFAIFSFIIVTIFY